MNEGSTPAPATNFTARTPNDVAAQLERDADSLKLTGESAAALAFSGDQKFYNSVAANLREAALLLRNWQPAIEQLQRSATVRAGQARHAAFAEAEEIAMATHDLVPGANGGSANTWRVCAAAILEAIRVQRFSPAPDLLKRLGDAEEVRT